MCNLQNRGCDIFCGRTKTGCVVRLTKVVINSFRNTDDTDITADAFTVFGKLIDGIHGIVASDIEKSPDILFFKLIENVYIRRIVINIMRKLVTAGP